MSSTKAKKKRIERAERQEKQAQIVIRCIFAALILLAICYAFFAMSM